MATDLNNCTGSQSYFITVGCNTLGVIPASLPSGTVGASYSQTFTDSAGRAPETYSVTSGSLPAGLTLSSAGLLTGTPTSPGGSTFTITVDAPTGSVPTGFTATVTTTDGATSEFSRPVGLSD